MWQDEISTVNHSSNKLDMRKTRPQMGENPIRKTRDLSVFV
jgi:hypothetical protein